LAEEVHGSWIMVHRRERNIEQRIKEQGPEEGRESAISVIVNVGNVIPLRCLLLCGEKISSWIIVHGSWKKEE
jgi:hypothetical protein